MTPECRVSPIPLSLLRLVSGKQLDNQQFCDLMFYDRERMPSSSLPAPTFSFLAPPLPSNSCGLQQKSTCLTQKSFQPNNLKSKLKLNLANTSTCLKPISTTPVRRSFKSAVEEAGMMEEVELLDDDEVFIKDLDLNIVHKLSLRDMPFLPALF